jgi:hypothetical protein
VRREQQRHHNGGGEHEKFEIISADSPTGGVVEGKGCAGNSSATSMGGGEQERQYSGYHAHALHSGMREDGAKGMAFILPVEGLYCKRPIPCLASSKILTPHPVTARRVCTPPPLVRG